MKKYAMLAVAALAFAGNAFAAKYAIDPGHTQVEFTYSHFGFSNITGRFDQVTGEFDLNTKDLAKSKISVEIPISSISTGVEKLDQHLKGPDFFNADKFPSASFKSTMVHVVNEKQLHVMGDLSIHGVTRPATLNVTVNKLAELGGELHVLSPTDEAVAEVDAAASQVEAAEAAEPEAPGTT
jgi:polyisoprenoid-binding protein YceI